VISGARDRETDGFLLFFIGNRAASSGVFRLIEPGVLWERVDEISSREIGRALESVGTRCEILVEDGIPYQVRTLEGAHPKGVAIRKQRRTGRNPFLPPEPELTVGELSETHLAVLNKFNVFGGHLLVITRRFEPQKGLLTLEDFDALLAAMEGRESLGFYNAGPTAGASQAHRHLQVAPLPLGCSAITTMAIPPEHPTPIDAVITKGQALPYPAAIALLTGENVGRRAAENLYDLFLERAATLGIDGGDRPYNLLLTRRWMIVVARTRDRFEGISINALGFAGSLLVRDRESLARVRDIGPGTILRGVTAEDPAVSA